MKKKRKTRQRTKLTRARVTKRMVSRTMLMVKIRPIRIYSKIDKIKKWTPTRLRR